MTHEKTSPQVEDGHTRIANELLEAMCRAGFSARQWAVVMAVVRKTYGYGKKGDDIGLGQLEQMTGIDKGNLSRVVRELADARVLTRTEGMFGHKLGVNKRYAQWRQKGATRGAATLATGDYETGLPDQQPWLPVQQPQMDDSGGAESATGVASLATAVGVVDSATGVVDLATVAESAKLGLSNRQPQKETIQKKEKPSRTILSDSTCDRAVPARQSGGADEPSPEFMTAWSAYPKREGGNPRKAAWTAWKARIRAGEATAPELVEATRGYAKFCDAGNKTGTQFVLMASTFYGPGEHWREWLASTVPTGANVADGAKPWYAQVGFSNPWEAENAGCTEGNRWMWEDRQQVRTEQDWPAWKASQAAARGASA